MLLLGLPAQAKTRNSSRTTSVSASKSSHSKIVRSGKSSRSSLKKTKAQGWRTRGQHGIDNLRVREIQSALVRAHYLDGEPNGLWDARTKTAMERFQGDNGWQTKRLPDSRALIKLGLGPDHSNLINPETAFIGQPEPGKGGAPQN